MHAHLDRDLPLEEIAAAAYVSPFHSRVFKSSPAHRRTLISQPCVPRAQALLAETDLSVTEIGARVGYASSSHFSKAFRQATGLSPRAFRAALVGSERAAFSRKSCKPRPVARSMHRMTSRCTSGDELDSVLQPVPGNATGRYGHAN